MELEIWLRRVDNKEDSYYKCANSRAWDLIIESKSLQKIVDDLISKHDFKAKGSRPTSYHIDYDFFPIWQQWTMIISFQDNR